MDFLLFIYVLYLDYRAMKDRERLRALEERVKQLEGSDHNAESFN
mgnify:CR=1 FL=1